MQTAPHQRLQHQDGFEPNPALLCQEPMSLECPEKFQEAPGEAKSMHRDVLHFMQQEQATAHKAWMPILD